MNKMYPEKTMAAMMGVPLASLVIWRARRVGPPHIMTDAGVAYPSDQFAAWCGTTDYAAVCALFKQPRAG